MSSDNQLLVVREQISRLILWLSSWSQRETAQTPALRKEAVRWLCTAGPSVNKNVKETKVGQNSTQREFQDDVKGSLGCPGSYGIEKFRNHNLAYILMNLLCKFQFCLWWLPIFFFSYYWKWVECRRQLFTGFPILKDLLGPMWSRCKAVKFLGKPGLLFLYYVCIGYIQVAQPNPS